MASKRKQITNEIKLDILENKNKLTTTELSVKYELAPSTISTIFSNRDKIITNSKTNDNKSCNKRIRLSNYPQIEEAMGTWFNQIILKPNITIDGNMLRKQATIFSELLNIKDFKSSSGWLDGWKKRNNISFKAVVGEGGLVDPKVIENYRNVVLPSLLKGFDSRDVFNADETALFYKAMPNKTMYYKNMPANSTKRNVFPYFFAQIWMEVKKCYLLLLAMLVLQDV